MNQLNNNPPPPASRQSIDNPRFPRFLYGDQIEALAAIYRSVGLSPEDAERAAYADLQADFGYVALAA